MFLIHASPLRFRPSLFGILLVMTFVGHALSGDNVCAQIPGESGTQCTQALIPTKASNPPEATSATFPDGTGEEKTALLCYSLPYGGLGFFSNIVSYYSLAMTHVFKRRRLPPWTKSDEAQDNGFWRILGKIASLTQLVLTVFSSAKNISSCSASESLDYFTQGFVIMAASQLVISILLGLADLVPNRYSAYLLAPCVLAFAGPMACIFVLASDHPSAKIRAIWITFLVIGVVAGLGVWAAYQDHTEPWKLRAGLGFVGLAAAMMCSDWVVAEALGMGLEGFNDEWDFDSKTLWYLFFIGRKLGLLSF